MLTGEKNIRSYFKKGIIVDTTPLILLLAGWYNYGLIGKNRLTAEFTREDFDILLGFVSNFREIIVTPHVLAEVSNIVNIKIPKDNFGEFIGKIIEKLLEFKEIYIKKDEILSKKELKRVGITDTGIFLACEKNGSLILTKDFKFSGICKSNGLPVIHFDELRGRSWLIN